MQEGVIEPSYASVRGEGAKQEEVGVRTVESGSEGRIGILTTFGTARAIMLTLPLPPKECHQNFRGAHVTRERMAAVRDARYWAWAAATKLSETYGLLPQWDRCAVSLAFRFPDARRRDIWNFAGACKAYLDGLADAGVMADDSGIVFGQVSAVIDRGNPGVTITITPMEGE